MGLVRLKFAGDIAEIPHGFRFHAPLLQKAFHSIGNAAVVLDDEYFEHRSPPYPAVLSLPSIAHFRRFFQPSKFKIC